MKNIRSFLMVMMALILASLACGSVEVGVVTPTSENDLISVLDSEAPTPEVIVVETSEPTAEPQEDFSHLWVEYWNPVFNYGLAIPSHWRVDTESQGGYMMLWSYEQEFFDANSIKGWWIGGEPPEGAVKIDFAPLEVAVPEQSLEVAISDRSGLGDYMLISIEKTSFGTAEGAYVTEARKDNLEDTRMHIEIRLSPEIMLSVGTYPSSRLYSNDIQLILNSLVLDKSTPIVKPTAAPYPPLTVKNEELSERATASYPVAWYGHIASLSEGDPYDDKVVFSYGAGEVGIKGNTPEIEELIHSLRDATGKAEYVHLWGVLYCNIDDYNTCQLNVDRLEYEGEYTVGVEPIDKWVGIIQRTIITGEPVYVFVLSGNFPIWYEITAPFDPSIQDQIEALADSKTIVNVWGDLLVGVEGINGTRIEARLIDPSSPGALPSSAACESGYVGSVEEAIEFVQYNLEIGNHWPFSYFIGNPFAIGYFRSEGVSMPRDQAYQQLTDYLLPSPEEVFVTTDKAEYPSEAELHGVSIEDMWGPDVDVAATLYSTGWGEDGTQEAIIVIARCQGDTHDAYFWYGMLYGRFERNE